MIYPTNKIKSEAYGGSKIKPAGNLTKNILAGLAVICISVSISALMTGCTLSPRTRTYESYFPTPVFSLKLDRGVSLFPPAYCPPPEFCPAPRF